MLWNERPPPELLRSLLQEQTLLFLGPGIARAAGLTVQERFLDAAKGALRQSVPLQEGQALEQFLRQGTPPDIVQAFKDQLGNDAYYDFLRSQLRIPDEPPPPLLYALRALPVRVWLTTNIDHLAERALSHIEGTTGLKVIVTSLDQDDPIPLPGPGERVLIKLFGDADIPESLVLTTDDYEAYFRRRPALASRLKALLEVYSPLFVGYSVRDPEFRRIYSHIGGCLASRRRRAFALTSGINRFETGWWARRALRILHAGEEGEIEGAVRDLVRQLQQHRRPGVLVESESSPHATSNPAVLATTFQAILRAQLDWALPSWLVPAPGGGLNLRGAYVPLRLDAETSISGSREQQFSSLVAAAGDHATQAFHAPRGVDVATVIARGGRSIIRGVAGSGKTTLLLHLLQIWGEEALAEGNHTLVFYLPARALVSRDPAADWSMVDALTDHLATLVKEHPRDEIRRTVEHAFEEDRALLLVDGLDEVSPRAFAGVLEVLKRFRRAYRDACILMTCRTEGFVAEWFSDVPVYDLCPLDREQQQRFITSRMRMEPDASEKLLGALTSESVPWVTRLASHPLSLAMLCLHFTRERRLPAGRVELYESVLLQASRVGLSETGLLAWDRLQLASGLALATLEDVDIPLSRERMISLTQAHLKERGREPQLAGRVLADLTGPDGLLVNRLGVDGTYTFRHRLYQEFLAARRLNQLGSDAAMALLTKHADNPAWRVIWPTLSAFVADSTSLLTILQASRPADVVPLLHTFTLARRVDPRWLEEQVQTSRDNDLLGRLLRRLDEQVGDEVRVELLGSVLRRDKLLWQSDGGRLDARAVWIAVSTLDQIVAQEGPLAYRAMDLMSQWVGRPGEVGPATRQIEIPAGVFLHSDEAHGLPSRYVYLGAYALSVSPILVEQWRHFCPSHVMAGAGENFQGGDQPAIGMNWFEAAVAARWFGGRLPTEVEWDKAASWNPTTTRRRIWPWGDTWETTRCNTLETWSGQQQMGMTTPLSRYGEVGASLFGCLDMAGNVMEWTATRGDNTPERRVLKGGSWMASPTFARTAASVWLRPGFRSLGIGFRICFDPS